MPIIEADYAPSMLFKNGHFSTLYPFLLRKKKKNRFIRNRILTPDEDFFDVDWIRQENNQNLLILLHGLEGSSESQYINGMAHMMAQHNYNVAAINFRSCSGEMNLKCEMYHSGFTKDLHFFIENVAHAFKAIFICGFSLGGNVTMKYVSDGVFDISKKIKAVAGISVPCDLKGGSILLKKWYNHLYEKRFLKTLLQKVSIKYTMMPEKINISHISKIKSLWDFDEYYTASLHGFDDAEDYYKKCSSLQFLHKVNIPAMIINAKDDTFLAPSSFPYEIAVSNINLHLVTPKYGGHVGFANFRKKNYWTELKVLHFFNQNAL